MVLVRLNLARVTWRFWPLFLALASAAVPSGAPGSIVIVEPGETQFAIAWSPGLSSADCLFQAWEVKFRSRNLNGSLVGTWRDASECNAISLRDDAACNVTGLSQNSPYDLQIIERCTNSAADSPAGMPEQVLWTLPGYWDIHIGPQTTSTYVVADTLEDHAGCEVIKTCCDDQFSLCYSGNESRTVEVQRVDTEMGWPKQVGWGQDLSLRCHARSVSAFKGEIVAKIPADPPWHLRLFEPTHVAAQMVYHHGNFIGGCECASHQIQTMPEGTDDWTIATGDCLTADLRACNVYDLKPNARIMGRMQTTCLDPAMNSNWSDAVNVLITLPACKWTFNSSFMGAGPTELECVDKTFCDIWDSGSPDSSCCNGRGGRLRCPSDFPVMCQNSTACSSGQDHCCVATDADCSQYGGVRICLASMIPAEVPKFEDFNSYLASSLTITWSRGVYLSGSDSPCKFKQWLVEVAEQNDDGSVGTWVVMSNCAALEAEATSCQVGPDQGLISLQKYVARMTELCTEDALNSELSYTASFATTWPLRAQTPTAMAFSNIRDAAFTVSWTPGVAYQRHVQECDFIYWEVMIRLHSRYVQLGRAYGRISWNAEPPERDDFFLEYEEGSDWFLGCQSFSRDEPYCDPQSLESDRDYSVKVRERCQDPNADSDYIAGASKLRTAAVAAKAPENLTTTDVRKYRYELVWEPGDRRACIFWAWQVMTKPVGVDWPPEDQDNATIAGGGHGFVYSRNITSYVFKLPLGSNTQYGARVRERCTDPTHDGAWGYLYYPGVWTAKPVQADRLANVTIIWNWPSLLSLRFVAGEAGWIEDLQPDEPGYNDHSDCVYDGWYVEVSLPSSPNNWVVQQECLAFPRSFQGCDIYAGLEYGTEYNLRVREGCTDPSARSPENVMTVFSRSKTPAAIPTDLKAVSDSPFSYEISWEPGFSYDCVFVQWEVQFRSANDTNSSAMALGEGSIEEIATRIYGHSRNPNGVLNLEWSVAALECELPTNRELAWCRVYPLVPNAELDIRVREICDNPALHSQYVVLDTTSPEAPATIAVTTVLFGPGDEGNSLSFQFDGCNVGDCLDAVPQMIVAAKGELTWTLITERDFDLLDPGPYEPHDPVGGVIRAYRLQPDTLYFARVRLDCPSGDHMDGPFKEAELPFPTMPGCKWSRHSGRNEMLECADNSFCNISADETCCQSRGGRLRCPPERPWMCDDLSCDGDYCCEMDCSAQTGYRPCNASDWPANLPEIFEASSPSPARLLLTWGPRSYLTGVQSLCVFKRWDVQMAKVTESGLESWVHLSQCDYAGSRGLQSCTVDDLDFLQYYQVRFAELCTDSALDSLYNWTAPILIRGELAGSPVNVTVSVLDLSSIMIRWDPSTVGDCIFAAWEVRWREETGSPGPWTDATNCQDLTERNFTECVIDGLAAGVSYSVSIVEACVDVRTNSLPKQTEIFRWSEVDVWEVYLGPNPTLSLQVSTLSREVGDCEVIKVCCSDEFSVCYSTTWDYKLAASIVRTDEVSGWGQQLWLRCRSSAAEGPGVPAAAPASILLRDATRSAFHADFVLGSGIGSCLCAHPHLQLRPTGGEKWVSYGGDCADMALRSCEVASLLPDTTYQARVQVTCENSSMNSPWTYSSASEFATRPGCRWMSGSQNDTHFECEDGRFCEGAGCCGGQLRRCPGEVPVMCASASCGGDYCCVAKEMDCSALGGSRPCVDSQVPAKQPTIIWVNATSTYSLAVQWVVGAYVSGFPDPCSGQAGSISDFRQWAFDIAISDQGGELLSDWTRVEDCSSTDRGTTACEVLGLASNTFYVVRLSEACANSALDSDYSVFPAVRTKPVPAMVPTDLRIVELGLQSVRVAWRPGAAQGHCAFKAWQVQFRQWQQNGQHGTWQTAANCSSLASREDADCIVEPLVAMGVHELSVTELCEDPEANSPALVSAAMRATSSSTWEVYLGNSTSTEELRDVLLQPMHVAISAENGTGTMIPAPGEYSLCYGNGANLNEVSVMRTDMLGGWTTDAWLLCSTFAEAPARDVVKASAPSALSMVPLIQWNGAALRADFEVGSHLGTVGRCLCAGYELELKVENFSTPYGYDSRNDWHASPSGSCISGSLLKRQCQAETLIADAEYTSRLRLTCLDDSYSSDFRTLSQTVITPPACKWLTHSEVDNEFECMDGSLCGNATDGNCCNAAGGRARCPRNAPIMCERDLDCADGQDHCCAASEAECSSHGGPRHCNYAQIPSKAPVLTSVHSPAPGQLRVEWRLVEYLSGVKSRCSFSYWRLEFSDGVTWQMASECANQDRPYTSCTATGLHSNKNYSVRLREACTRWPYDSDWALWPSQVPTLPMPASAPSATCSTAAKSQGAMAMPISWTASSAGDCDFEAWQVFVMLQARQDPPAVGGAWQLACYSILQQDTSCTVAGLLSGRNYSVRVRQVCSDPDATSPFAELTGAACFAAAEAAESPANLTASSPGPYEVFVRWDANNPWACIFSAWQVQVKSQALDNWESTGLGCYSYDRDMTNCSVDVGLGSNTPYDVRVREMCTDSSLNSAWLTLPFPGVSTPLPLLAAMPQNLQVIQDSAFSIQISWSAGDSGDCIFSSWSVELVAPDGAQQAVATCATAARLSAACTATLAELNLVDTASSTSFAPGAYDVRVRELCTDSSASSPWVQQDAVVTLIASEVPPSDLTVAAASETWLALSWVPGFTDAQCSAIQWRVRWRQRVSGIPVGDWAYGSACSSLPCNVTGLTENSAYEVLVEEACLTPWSLASMGNESTVFWTMPGEWTTFVGSSLSAVTVTVSLTEQPYRCYVQKECCSDEFFICHSGSTGQTVDITRSDVPGGWGQSISLVCVTPALAGLSERPKVQATGPASLLLSPRDNQSVTVTYPEKLATTMQGCECASIYLEMAVEGSGDWLRRTGVDGLCSDWGTRRCVVDNLAAGQIYEGRVQIMCSDTSLTSNWTVAGATVSTNLEAFVVTGSISVQSSARRLASSGAFRARLKATLSQVSQVEETSILVEDGAVNGVASLDFVLATSTIGLELNEAEAETVAEAVATRLKSSFSSDFDSRLSATLGYSVFVEVLQPVEVERQSQAFASCGSPPLVANAAVNWTQSSCLGRTWSDGPCAVPCDVGFLPEGSGFRCGVDGFWFDIPRCASIWTVGEWGECLGVPGNCGEGGIQRRQVTCPQGANGCHAMSKPKEEQACRATSGCYWVTGSWSSCSKLCGTGVRLRDVTCSSPIVSDCQSDPPSANESCSDFTDCRWQVQPWGPCSSSCGAGTETREAACEALDATLCPAPAPVVLQYCYETAGCEWQTSSWSSCSSTCGEGLAQREVWCASGADSDCNSEARPSSSQPCHNVAGCSWVKGEWSQCSSTCGSGLRSRSVSCPSGQAADCPGDTPASTEACYETATCQWLAQAWSGCDNACGAGTRTRPVICSSGGPDADCAGERPPTAEPCYDTIGCQWAVGDWSACSSACGPGMRRRSVTCPSGWPEDCSAVQVEPHSSESCRGTTDCIWDTAEWSECSNDCGNGVIVRSVTCSGGIASDCESSEPISEMPCRVVAGCNWTISAWSSCNTACGAGTQGRTAACTSGNAADCAVPGPAVSQHCYETAGCLWQSGEWSPCSSSCGVGTRERSVECSSGQDGDCPASERPMSSEVCYERSGCMWQTGNWGACSSTCGSGLRTREVWCPSLIEADCTGTGILPSRSESCYGTSGCTWHVGEWSSCSNDCGTGFEVRPLTCSSGHDADCQGERPLVNRSCFDSSNCAWVVGAWEPCNATCGEGWQARVVHCLGGEPELCPGEAPATFQSCRSQASCQWLPGAWSTCSSECEPGTRARNITCSGPTEADCSQVPKPPDRETCNAQATGCDWILGPWSACSATACQALGSRLREVVCPSQHGDAGCPWPKPKEVESCLSDRTCVWEISEWSDCDATCGGGEKLRQVRCTSPDEEECPGERPVDREECYSTANCAWWTGSWTSCNATCGNGWQTRALVCGSDVCNPSSAPSSARRCWATSQCSWQLGEWGNCSNRCGSGVSERNVQCPSGDDLDCNAMPRPLDRRSCRDISGCTWSTSPWSACSQTCGQGTATRAVVCPSGDEADCSSLPRPEAEKSCFETIGCSWKLGPWSSCSNDCGTGNRSREVRCPSTRSTEDCGLDTPANIQPCSSSLGCGWIIGEWGPCDATCGEGRQTRLVECVEPGGCPAVGPATTQACTASVGCHWKVGSWSDCSDGCGRGLRQRRVLCSGGGDDYCALMPRPSDAEVCDDAARPHLGAACGWQVGEWGACGTNCGPRSREVSCGGNGSAPGICFGRKPAVVVACQDADCSTPIDSNETTARFSLQFLMDIEMKPETLNTVIYGARKAVADMLGLDEDLVQVHVVSNSAGRRLSAVMKLEVELLKAPRSSTALLASDAGQDLLSLELVEEWDSLGVPLDDFSVLIGPIEEPTRTSTSTQMSSMLHIGPPRTVDSDVNLMIVVAVAGSAIATACVFVICWLWRQSRALRRTFPDQVQEDSPQVRPEHTAVEVDTAVSTISRSTSQKDAWAALPKDVHTEPRKKRSRTSGLEAAATAPQSRMPPDVAGRSRSFHAGAGRSQVEPDTGERARSFHTGRGL